MIGPFYRTERSGPPHETREFVGWEWCLLVRTDADGHVSVHLECERTRALIPPGPNYHSNPHDEMRRLRDAASQVGR